MFSYTVRCEFSDPEVARQWIEWLRQSHIRDVLNAGAQSAEVFSIIGEHETYEIRYRFASQQDFAAYELHHAPRLRKEGLEKFPLELGLRYTRATAELVFHVD
jgi:hypothetical protein